MVSKDKQVIEDFGYEWEAYNQKNIDEKELEKLYLNYFNIFPFEVIGKESKGFDAEFNRFPKDFRRTW